MRRQNMIIHSIDLETCKNIPPTGIFIKKWSTDLKQIYRKTSMRKSNFNKVFMFFCNFTEYSPNGIKRKLKKVNN